MYPAYVGKWQKLWKKACSWYLLPFPYYVRVSEEAAGVSDIPKRKIWACLIYSTFYIQTNRDLTDTCSLP